MTITTTPTTVEELQQELATLREEKRELQQENEDLTGELEDLRDDVAAAERDETGARDGAADRLRQIVVDHHDDTRHRGSVRFCTEAPCPALNALLNDGELL